MSDFYKLQVVEKKQLTPESILISLEIPKNLKKKFQFQPGQFVMLEKEINGKNQRRYYSICAPAESDKIKLGIKFKGANGFAKYMMNELQKGEYLQVSEPMNDLAFDYKTSKKYLGITIGSGITPFFSMIQSILRQPTQAKFILIYGNHSSGKTMFKKCLDELSEKYPDRLKIYYVFSQEEQPDAFRGRIDRDIIDEVLEKETLDFDDVYMVGPEDLKKNAAAVLIEHKIPADNIHFRIYS